MKPIPESANRADWPRLVAIAINWAINAIGKQHIFPPMVEPASPVEGQTYMDSTSHKLRTYNGTAWQEHW